MKINFQKSSPLKREAHNFCFQKTFLKTTEACFRIYFFKWKPSFQKRPGHCRLLFSKKAKTETRNIGSAEQPIHLYSSLSLVRRTLPLDPPSRDAFFSDPATLSRLLSAAEATPSSEIIESPGLHCPEERLLVLLFGPDTRPTFVSSPDETSVSGSGAGARQHDPSSEKNFIERADFGSDCFVKPSLLGSRLYISEASRRAFMEEIEGWSDVGLRGLSIYAETVSLGLLNSTAPTLKSLQLATFQTLICL